MEKTEELLQLEREQLRFQKDNLSLFQSLVKGQSEIKSHVINIDNKHGKSIFIIMSISFLSGIIIGTQYMTWLPYADKIFETYQKAHKITRSVE